MATVLTAPQLRAVEEERNRVLAILGLRRPGVTAEDLEGLVREGVDVEETERRVELAARYHAGERGEKRLEELRAAEESLAAPGHGGHTAGRPTMAEPPSRKPRGPSTSPGSAAQVGTEAGEVASRAGQGLLLVVRVQAGA